MWILNTYYIYVMYNSYIAQIKTKIGMPIVDDFTESIQSDSYNIALFLDFTFS